MGARADDNGDQWDESVSASHRRFQSIEKQNTKPTRTRQKIKYVQRHFPKTPQVSSVLCTGQLSHVFHSSLAFVVVGVLLLWLLLLMMMMDRHSSRSSERTGTDESGGEFFFFGVFYRLTNNSVPFAVHVD